MNPQINIDSHECTRCLHACSIALSIFCNPNNWSDISNGPKKYIILISLIHIKLLLTSTAIYPEDQVVSTLVALYICPN